MSAYQICGVKIRGETKEFTEDTIKKMVMLILLHIYSLCTPPNTITALVESLQVSSQVQSVIDAGLYCGRLKVFMVIGSHH